MNKDLENELQEENPVDVIRREYLPFWPFMVLAGLLGLLVVYTTIRYMDPVYESKARIMFRSTNQNPTQQVISEMIGVGSQSQDKTKQNLEILQSHTVAMNALQELKLNAQIFKKGRINTSPHYKKDIRFECIFFNPDSIRPFRGEIEFDKQGRAFIGGQQLKFNQKSLIGRNEFIFNIDPADVEKLKSSEHVLVVYSNDDLKKIFSEMKVVETKTKPSVEISIEGDDPRKARDMLSALLTSYDRVAIEDNRDEATNTIRFIDGRLDLIEGELDSVEMGIEIFKKANPMVALSSEGTQLLQQLRDSDAKLAEISLQLNLMSDIENYLQGRGKRPGMLPSFAGMQFGEEIQQFMLKLYDAELEHETVKATSAEKSELYIVSREKLNTLRSTIGEFVVNVRRNLMTIKAQAEREASRYNGMISALPTQERKLFDINRQQLIKNELYTFLLQKREESAITAAAAVSDLIVLEPPTLDAKPINIKAPLFYSIGLIGGVGLVILFIALSSFFSNKLSARTQLEALTRIPVLAEIAYHKDSTHLVMSGDSRSMIAEQFRALRTNIGYYKKQDRDCMVIAVTSSIPGEGKSFNAANIALAFAMTGAETLLIESDLRKPNISKHFNLKRNTGLSNFLVGNVTWMEVVRSTEHEHLSILPSGPIPPNPVELIMNGRYEALLNDACGKYKYVVIDCPPLGVVTDAELIAKHADLMLFITRHNHTPKDFIPNLVNKYYEEKKITQVGLVFNGILPKGLGYYGYKYGYRYGYGYKYGYGYGYQYGYGYYSSEKTES